MINYTCVICEKEYPYEYTRLIDNHLVCSQCLWDELWKKHTDPRKPVLDLIDRLQGEAGYASGGDIHARVYSALDVHEILIDIQRAIEDMEV